MNLFNLKREKSTNNRRLHVLGLAMAEGLAIAKPSDEN